MAFRWNSEKNELLKKERGISFEQVTVAIEQGHLLGVLEHPNKVMYLDQILILVEIDGYAVCIPAVEEAAGDFFLKTLFPSRKYTKLFGLEAAHDNPE